MHGVIRRRLLVNAMADPDEVATRLPPGVRPHVTAQGTVVGCCLLEIEHIRPTFLPRVLGRSLRAVAHRISAEWLDADGTTIVGVYVPVRHTDSRFAVVVGGRGFPGVHERARVRVSGAGHRVQWHVDPVDPTGLGIRVSASYAGTPQAATTCGSVGATCLGAELGVSPDHGGQLEVARMDLSHHNAREAVIEDLACPYLDGFATAVASTSYLMCDVDVVWTRGTAPSLHAGVTA